MEVGCARLRVCTLHTTGLTSRCSPVLDASSPIRVNRPAVYSQPACSAMRAASTLFRAPTFVTADAR